MGNDSYRFHSELKLGQSQKFQGLSGPSGRSTPFGYRRFFLKSRKEIKELFFESISLVSE